MDSLYVMGINKEKYLKLPSRRMPSSPSDHSPKRQAKKEVAKLGELYG